MTIRYGLLATLVAKPGKGDDLANFLEKGRALAAAEPDTATWYAFKIDETTYGIFDTFETEDGRNAHINGEIPRALASVSSELLARDAEITPLGIVAVK